jgi:Leucine-rich repeat (LRR) protein
MKKKILIELILLTVLMLITTGVVYAADKTNQVKFADPVVETAVREGLKGKTGGPVYRDEAELITILSIHGNGDVIDLTGLEYLSKLRQLTIYNATFTDCSPLSGLIDFKYIGFNGCEITDLAPLSILPNLESLNLTDCLINDSSSLNLSSLTGLRGLDITDTPIYGISQISFPADLWSLNLQNNRISDIPNLSNLTHLVYLDIYENQISDISPILALPETRILASLTLSENLIRDITPLAKLNMLSGLHLSGNHISDISVLSSLSRLEYLNLEDNDIVDLAPLLEMDISQKGFRKTYVDGAEYTVRMELHIQGNPLSSVSIEKCIPQLKERGILADY